MASFKPNRNIAFASDLTQSDAVSRGLTRWRPLVAQVEGNLKIRSSPVELRLL